MPRHAPPGNGFFIACFAVCLAILSTVSLAAESSLPAGSPFRDGDRVVFVGDAFVEREGDRGFIETALVAMHPEAKLTCRNLGWSGDTVWAESRGVFDQPAKGYERMLSLIREIKPTVVIVAYGRNESFKGEVGLPAFRGQLGKLCDDLRATGDARTPQEVRLVLVTPHRFEPPAADFRNAALAGYVQAIRDVAAAKNATLVDLFTRLAETAEPGVPLTENGVHLSDAGYALAAGVFTDACGRPLPADFAARSEELRRLVIAKNTLFFHRWRPANETYIFLFRRHEQGNNAVEIPQFDPLVEKAEQKVRAFAGEFR